VATPAGTARKRKKFTLPWLKTPQESLYEERLLRAKALALGARGKNALISAKNTEIRQIEPFAVRLAEAVPAESVHLKRKSTLFVFPV